MLCFGEPGLGTGNSTSAPQSLSLRWDSMEEAEVGYFHLLRLVRLWGKNSIFRVSFKKKKVSLEGRPY